MKGIFYSLKVRFRQFLQMFRAQKWFILLIPKWHLFNIMSDLLSFHKAKMPHSITQNSFFSLLRSFVSALVRPNIRRLIITTACRNFCQRCVSGGMSVCLWYKKCTSTPIACNTQQQLFILLQKVRQTTGFGEQWMKMFKCNCWFIPVEAHSSL